MKWGDLDIDSFKVGDLQVDKVMQGDVEVWINQAPYEFRGTSVIGNAGMLVEPTQWRCALEVGTTNWLALYEDGTLEVGKSYPTGTSSRYGFEVLTPTTLQAYTDGSPFPPVGIITFDPVTSMFSGASQSNSYSAASADPVNFLEARDGKIYARWDDGDESTVGTEIIKREDIP